MKKELEHYISARTQEQEEELLQIFARAQFDSLTGAYAKNTIQQMIECMLKEDSRFMELNPSAEFSRAFILFDIDGFRELNLSLGVQYGDDFLTHIVSKIQNKLHDTDYIGRIGGDEFLIVVSSTHQMETLCHYARSILGIIHKNISNRVQVSCSIGISVSPKDGTTLKEIKQKTDQAMYEAKKMGGDAYRFYKENYVMKDSSEQSVDSEIGDAFSMHMGRSYEYNALIAYDCTSTEFIYSSSFSDTFPVTVDGRSFVQMMVEDRVCSHDDAQKLAEKISEFASSERPNAYFTEMVMKNGETVWHWFRVGIVRTDKSRYISIIFTDINQEIAYNKHLSELTEMDEMTGLFNRKAFGSRVDSIRFCDPDGFARGEYYLIYFDIIKFKAINDFYGMAEGDRLLIYISEGIIHNLNGIGFGCRVGSDRFALFFHGSEADVKRLLDSFQEDLTNYGLPMEISYNAGVFCTATSSMLSATEMLDRAILAQETVKGNYISKYCFFDESMRDDMLTEQEIVGVMSNSLQKKEFVVYYQPKYNNSSGKLAGAEALVRWKHPEKGLISPGTFIPIFEKNDFITKVDLFVFEQTCKLIRKRMDTKKPLIPISTNISRKDIFQNDFIEKIEEIRMRYRVPVEYIRLEITESAMVSSEGNFYITQIIKKLHDCGYVIEMDDFGSGYSSLNVLKDFNLDIIKLDMKFLYQETESNRGGTILSSVVKMAQRLNMPVIAEGVENSLQADFLRSIGCEFIQGYLYSRPLPEEDFNLLLDETADSVRDVSIKSNYIEQLDAMNFWNPESMETLIFNTFVGGAYIFDYHNGTIDLLRVNRKYLKELGTGLTEKEIIGTDIFTIMDEENVNKFKNTILKAIDNMDENECEIWGTVKDINSANTTVCIRNMIRLIGKNQDNYLFYATVRNITAEKNASCGR